MTVESRQQELLRRFQILPSPQERLNALVDRSAKVPPLPDSDKTDENRVYGCQSKVFVIGRIEDGVCRFRADADSVLVRALVILLCELYEGGLPSEVIETEPELLRQLGIWQILSPTRQNGLGQVRRVIRAWAEKLA